MFKLLTRAIGGGALLLAIAGAAAGQADLPAVTIALSPDGLSTPETIAAGWVEITFENTAETPLMAIMARLDEEATMGDFMGALGSMMSGETGIVPPATFVGAPATPPGATQSTTYHLAPGDYVLLNIAGGAPQIATFAVEGEVAESDFEPEADLTVTLVDFAFGLPAELPAGPQTWLIDNIGEQWHELVVIPVPDGTTLEDAMALMMAGEGEAETEGEGEAESQDSTSEFAAFWSPMSAGERAWVEFDLAPGTYLVSCFIPDVNSDEHASHAALGMMQIVTVTEAQAEADE